MIKSAPYYWITCDGCRRSAHEDQEHSAWYSEASAVEVAMDETGWTTSEDWRAHYCPACTRIRQPEGGAQ